MAIITTMKLLVNIFLVAAITFTAAYAEGGPDNGPALMIIRFNQKSVNYHDKLAYVVHEAVKTKSDVVFDVVDIAPASGQAVYGQIIASDIQSMGVAASQVNIRSENGGSNEEVRIFVR